MAAYRPGEYGPPRYRPRRPAARRSLEPPRRSHAAIPLALVVLFVGLVLGAYSFLLPALFGLAVLGVAFTFFSSRVNPFSTSFYLTVKPSWLSIGVLALIGLGLLGIAWSDFAATHGLVGAVRIP